MGVNEWMNSLFLVSSCPVTGGSESWWFPCPPKKVREMRLKQYYARLSGIFFLNFKSDQSLSINSASAPYSVHTRYSVRMLHTRVSKISKISSSWLLVCSPRIWYHLLQFLGSVCVCVCALTMYPGKCMPASQALFGSLERQKEKKEEERDDIGTLPGLREINVFFWPSNDWCRFRPEFPQL